MRKKCCLILALLFCWISCFSVAEEMQTTTGYAFDLRFHLNPDSFSPSQRTRLRGYADLLEVLSFHGSFCFEHENRTIDFTLDIIPDDPDSEPICLHFFGYPDNMMLSSSLTGKETILFSNISLLEFVNKIHEHLGLNLQYGAPLYPYVYEYSLRYVIRQWNRYFNKKSESRSITAKRISQFAGYLEKSYSEHKDMETLIRTLCLSGDYEETIRAEVYNLPVWLTEKITRGKPIKIQVGSDSETWSVGKKIIYKRQKSASDESIHTDLPLTPGGFQPALNYSRHTESDHADLALDIEWTRDAEEPLFSLHFLGNALPLAWPSDASADGEFALLGGLYPNFAFGFSLQSDSSGHTLVRFREASDDAHAEEIFLTAEGTVLPQEYTVSKYTRDDFDACVDILRVNDVTLADFLSDISGDAAMGLVRFLVGIPASSCQSLLDDLTDLGILDLLLTN